MATLAGEDYTTATTQMTAAIRGFHMEMDEGSRITDVYSELAANAAADVQGIAYAMSKTASIANNAGMAFETTAAFITNMIETTQEAPENIGTAMKTIIARFTELKENVDDSGEDLESMDFNKVDKALKSVGVQLKDTTGSFRNLDDVFLELSSKWDTLTRNQQRYIATIAAGSRQQSRFIAMMEDYDRTLELVETAQNSVGRSDEQFAKYADTITFKLNQLKNSWEELRVSFLNADDYKKGLDIANGFLNTIKNIDPKTLIVDVAIFGIIGKNIVTGIINALKNSTTQINQAFNDMIDRLDPVKAIDKKIQSYTKDFVNKYKIKLNENNIQMPNINKIVEQFTPYIEVKTNLKDIDKDLEQIGRDYNIIKTSINQTLEEHGKTIRLDDEKITKLQEIIRLYPEITAEELAQQAAAEHIVTEAEELENLTNGDISALKRLGNEQSILNAKKQEQLQKQEQIKKKLAEQGYSMTYLEGLESSEIAKLEQELVEQEQITLERQKQLQISKSILSSGISSAVSSAITIGLTTGFSTGDWSAALKTGLITFGTSMIPVIVNFLTKLIILGLKSITFAVAAPIIGIVAIIGAAIASTYINSVENAYKQNKKKLENEKKEIEKQLEEDSEKLNKSKEKRDEYKNQVSSLNELRKAYEDYSKKVVHTEEEQQKYQETLQKYSEDFPNLISLQNDEYRIQNKLLEEQIELYNRKLQAANIEYAQDKLQANKDEADLIQNEKSQNDLDYTNTMYDINQFSFRKKYNTTQQVDDWLGIQSKNDIKELKKINDETNGAFERIYNEMFDTNYDFSKLEKMSKEERRELTNRLYKMSKEDEEILKEELVTVLTEIDEENVQTWEDGISEYNINNKQIIKDNLMADGFSNNLSEYLFNTIDNIEDFIDPKNYKKKIKELEEKGQELEEISSDFDKVGSLSKEEMDALSEGKYNKITSEEGKKAVKVFQSAEGDEEKLKYLQDILTNNRIQNWQDAVDSFKELTPNAERIWDLSKLTAEEVKAIKIQYDNFLKKAPEDKRGSIDSMQEYLQSSSGLSKNDYQKAWGQVNWADLGIENLEVERKKFIDSFKESGDTAEKGAQAWEKALSIYQDAGVISLDFNDPEKAQEWLDKQKEELEKTFSEDVSIQLALKPSGEKLSIDELEEWQQYADEIGEDIETFVDLETMTINVDAEYYEAAKMEGFETINRTILTQQDSLKKLANETNLAQEKQFESAEDVLKKYNEITQKKEEGIALDEDEISFYDKLTPKVETINSLEKTRNDMTVSALIQRKKEIDAIIEARKEEYETLKGLKDAQDNLNQAIEDETKKTQEAQEKINEQIKKNTESEEKVLKEINDALKDVTEQEETILEKEQAIVDKTQELNDALYGTSNYLSKRDSLQNYSDRLDQLSSAAEKAKNALDNPEIGDNIAELVKNYGEAIHQEMVYQQALNQRKEDQKNQILGYLQGFGSEYFSMVDGYLQANYSAIDNAQMNDQLKDQIYQYLDDYNKVQKEIIDGEDKYNDLLKEMKERRKSALSDMVNLQKDTAEILKESYEKEIEDVKEKYDAIKEADDEYLDALQDAIDKQRKLRDEEDKWNDLATKEKKLSLISRDTSGSQQKETLKLQEEIEKDRQSLLDSSIDNILETLKETYEEQQKEREEELEYQEQMIEDMDFMKQAMEIIQSMNGSSENYLAWLMQNDPEYLEGSPLEQELYLEEHANDLAPFEEYAAITNSNFQDYLNITVDEVNQVMAQTSDNMNEYLERSHQNTLDKVQEEQDAAQEALNQAYEDLDEAKLKLEELHKKVNEAYENYDQTLADGEKDLQEAYENYEQVTKDTKDKVKEMQIAYNEAMDEVHNKGITDITDIDKKVEESYNRYMTEQGNAEQKLLDYKDQLLDYGESAASIVNAYTSGQTQEFMNEQYEKGSRENGKQIIDSIRETKFKYITDLDNAKASGDPQAIQFASAALDAFNSWASSQVTSFNSSSGKYGIEADGDYFKIYEKHAYATGGLVNYTGPAWVDGSPTRPEAFLSAEDTARIGAAAQLLSNIPALNSSSITDNSYSSNIGDTTIEVHINVENISSEVDIDEAVKRVENDIVEMSNSIGNPILLNK